MDFMHINLHVLGVLCSAITNTSGRGNVPLWFLLKIVMSISLYAVVQVLQNAGEDLEGGLSITSY